MACCTTVCASTLSIERNVPCAKYLERLIPGDEGFEPPAVPMIEHRKDVSMAPIDSPDTVKIEDDEF